MDNASLCRRKAKQGIWANTKKCDSEVTKLKKKKSERVYCIPQILHSERVYGIDQEQWLLIQMLVKRMNFKEKKNHLNIRQKD